MDRWNWPLGAGVGGSRSYRAALTPPAHPKQYRGCHLTLRPSFVTILHDSFGGGSRGQNTTMACPYNVSSRDEQRSGFVTNCCSCDSIDGLVLHGKILYVGLWTGRAEGRCVISGLGRVVLKTGALLGYYAASSCNYRRFGTTCRSYLKGSHWRWDRHFVPKRR